MGRCNITVRSTNLSTILITEMSSDRNNLFRFISREIFDDSLSVRKIYRTLFKNS